MNVRPATEADEVALRELWEEFDTEVPAPAGFAPDTWERDWAALRENMRTGGVILAEDDQGPTGFADASMEEGARWHLQTVHVRPRVRRQGVAAALLRASAQAARERGAVFVSLDVLATNELARTVWQRLGFAEIELVLGQTLESLERRLADVPIGASRAATHVQTDDSVSVGRALAQFLPRLEAPEVRAEANGWIKITDPLTDDDRDAQGRLAGELSDRLGAVAVALAIEAGQVVRFRLYERGLMVDEYLSVPLFYGALPKVEELALAANPTLVARLTGADREQVRQVARTASAPGELPPADELYDQIARTMGLEP
jgi:ribosomal protein S18 acetylase RimI-like enzyme